MNILPVGGAHTCDAYGNAVNFTPGVLPVNFPLTKLLYMGKQFDTGLQQQYLRARYYDPTIGRFNRMDPRGVRGYGPKSFGAPAEPIALAAAQTIWGAEDEGRNSR